MTAEMPTDAGQANNIPLLWANVSAILHMPESKIDALNATQEPRRMANLVSAYPINTTIQKAMNVLINVIQINK